MPAQPTRPRVICHMMMSIDGRIVPTAWPLSSEGMRQYELVHAHYGADAWLCGRITMEPFAGGVRSQRDIARVYGGRPRRPDFRATGDFDSFAFAVDPSGRLAWRSNNVSGDHVVAILSHGVSQEYLEFLRDRGVSYILAGRRDVDLAIALEKIRALFGVRSLMLEGGGKINGSMLRAGLIDEVSVLVAPVVDGRVGTPALFDVEKGARPRRLALVQVQKRDDGVLWLRYRVRA